MMQAWISLGRFASRLGPRAAWHLDPRAPAVPSGIFEDRDGDLLTSSGQRKCHGWAWENFRIVMRDVAFQFSKQ